MTSENRQVICSEKAAKAIGPYSAAIRSGNLVFVSGNLGIGPQTGQIVSGGIEAETRQALSNISRILEAADSSIKGVVKTTVFMQDLGDFAAMNAVYAEFFTDEPPARSIAQVAALPKGAAIEIEAIALVGS
jgi:2-iminobutanoate/2-iminopropanoate deaminase